MSASLEVGLLGPLEVRRDDEPVRIAAPKQRALLTLLALDVGRVVSADELADRLWAGNPPTSAVTALQVYISQLRKLLGSDVIVTRPPGYVLDLPADAVDAVRFEQRVVEGRASLTSGDFCTAELVLGEAVSVWRGSALAEFVYEDWAAAPIRRLEELRLVALEDRIDAQLELGKGTELTGELEGLVREFPLRERLRAQHMVALYRAGRQADALSAYQDARTALVERLGIDPSPSLVELERRILQQDASLAPPRQGSHAKHAVARAETSSEGQGEVTGSSGADQLSTVRAEPRRERKLVTVLFCDLVDFTATAESADPEDVDSLLTRYYAIARREIEQRGGVVEKFIGDAVVGVFGAPLVHEDDAARAIESGMAILTGVAELRRGDPTLNVHVRVGINTGDAVVTLDADPASGEGPVSGDVVNTAARIQTAADVDSVLIGDATYRSVPKGLEASEPRDLQVKGKRTAVRVRAVRGLGPSRFAEVTTESAEFTGRARELALLEDAFSRVCTDQTAEFVLVIGQPGIGKSRLLREFQRRVAGTGSKIRWAVGRCQSYGAAPLVTVADLVRSCAAIVDSDRADTVRDKMHQLLDRILLGTQHDPMRAELLDLVGVGEATDSVPVMNTDMFTVWRRFFEACALTAPMVVVFEDVHWADDDLLEFIAYLADWARSVPLLILATARPDVLDRKVRLAGTVQSSSTIALNSLSEHDVRRLVSSLGAGHTAVSEMMPTIIERAEGNPLYVEEYVRTIGRDRPAGGHEVGVRDDRLSDDPTIPETIQGVIAARIDRLPPETKKTLQLASVLGTTFWASGVEQLTRLPPEDVEHHLHRLERLAFVRRSPGASLGSSDVEYRFQHGLVQDVAYHELPRATRFDGHQRAAEWITRTMGDRSDATEALARHHLEAYDLARVLGIPAGPIEELLLEELRVVGDRAAALASFTVAVAAYERALALWPIESDERLDLMLHLGAVLVRTSDEYPQVLAEVIAPLVAKGQVSKAAEAEYRLGIWLWHHGRAAEGRVHHERAVSLIRATPDTAEKAEALINFAFDSLVSEERDAGFVLADEAHAIARRLGIELLEGYCLALRALGRFGGDDPGFETEIKEAIAIAGRASSPRDKYTSLGILFNSVELCMSLGRLHEAAELTAQARVWAQEIRSGHGLATVEAQEIEIAYQRGEWDEAERRIRTALAGDPRAHGVAHGEYRLHILFGEMQLHRGAVSDALHHADTALALARDYSDMDKVCPALAFLAGAALRAGARQAPEALSELLGSPTRLLQAAWALPTLAQAIERTPRRDDVLAVLERVRVVTPWVAAAKAMLRGSYVEAAEYYSAMGARPAWARAWECAAARTPSIVQGEAARREHESAEAFLASVEACAAGSAPTAGTRRTSGPRRGTSTQP
jgi:DNA-binding SARP family transcriptional activator/tetratricopeptide (TPR) repeat protein